MDEIAVSVCCTVYNHEKYLRKCLDGFVMQKTNFKFEVIVHDDASTDHSADIIREYQNKYPEIIKPIYQTENQYSKKKPITKTFIWPQIRGKYIAVCEGDDYWCCDHKLQKQFDYMEQNPQCSIAVHKVCCVDEGGNPLGSTYPAGAIHSKQFSTEEFLNYLFIEESYPFQTSSYFRRKNIEEEKYNEDVSFFKDISFGDIPTLLYFSTKGTLYFDEEVMSCYRVGSIGSWNTTLGKNYQKILQENILMLQRFDQYTDHRYQALVQTSIVKKEFYCFQKTGQYKKMLGKKYKDCFRKLTYKEKIYVYYRIIRSLVLRDE